MTTQGDVKKVEGDYSFVFDENDGKSDHDSKKRHIDSSNSDRYSKRSRDDHKESQRDKHKSDRYSSKDRDHKDRDHKDRDHKDRDRRDRRDDYKDSHK